MQPAEYLLHDDIAAIATALSPAALGIVRTSGNCCIERLSRFFSRSKALQKAAGHTLLYGWLQDGNIKIDEVVICVYRAPKSNTGEDAAEIICHGGMAVVKAVYDVCIKYGFRPAERGEFTFRSFINGKTDLTRAEAVHEIINSKTGIAREKAAKRLSGSVFKKIDSIKTALLTALASLEVEIEYPEDEDTLADNFDISLIKEPLSELRLLHSTWQSEKLYQTGVKVVLAGKPNAGKSSLFNALLKEDRAIVSDIPGTTRDWLQAALDFNGIPVILFDTAGICITEDTIEAIGVQRTVDLASTADIILYLIDSSISISEDDIQFIENSTVSVLPVYTKSDKTGQTPDKNAYHTGTTFQATAKSAENDRGILISIKTGVGIKELIDAVCTMVLATPIRSVNNRNTSVINAANAICSVENANTATVQTDAEVCLGSARQKEAVSAALQCLEHAKTAADAGFPLDAIIQDIEDAAYILGGITGEVRSDDVLDALFSGFCVGK